MRAKPIRIDIHIDEEAVSTIIETLRLMTETYRRPAPGHSDEAATALSNACYFILRSLGYTDREARELFSTAPESRGKNPRIVSIEPTDEKNTYRVFFERGEPVLVRATSHAEAYYND